MPIFHKFYNVPPPPIGIAWDNRFQTHNAILDVTPYEPEVMFIGTYNPDIPGNPADFFYGRNYFWTGFKNLFTDIDVMILQKRIYTNPKNPTLFEIFALCEKLKLTFADLIQAVLHNNNPIYNLVPRNKVYYTGQDISLINDNGLQQLDGMGQVDWNTENIINYLCVHPKIKTIYFTRQPVGIWANHWNAIKNHPCLIGRNLINIYTPAGLGLAGTPRMTALLHHWVHYIGNRFGRIDRAWLLANGAKPSNF